MSRELIRTEKQATEAYLRGGFGRLKTPFLGTEAFNRYSRFVHWLLTGEWLLIPEDTQRSQK